MSRSLLVASVQLNSQDNLEDNLNTIEQSIKSASNTGAKLIVLPENTCLMGSQSQVAWRFDDIVQHYQTLARRYDVHILAGTLPCPTHQNGQALTNGKFYQSSLLFDNQGKLLARYDKIHLFCATVADGVGSYDEGRTFEAGNELVVARCHMAGMTVNVGMMVCFDVRFAIMAHRLRQLGADIITVPSAFTHTTGKAHWQTLLQARALDSQCLIVGATQGGTHHFTHKGKNHTRQTWGHAMLVDASGQVIASTDRAEVGTEGFAIAYANFDPDTQKQIREHMPLMACHKSNAVYQFS